MGGVVNSAGGFLGLSSGPQAPGVQSGNSGLGQLNEQNGISGAAGYNPLMQAYMNGDQSAEQVLSEAPSEMGLNSNQQTGLANNIATGATTGSKFATEQVQNNPILGSLFGKGGQLEGAEGKLNQLNSQGFQLTPEDYDLYGQTSGNLARMFGSQGNQISQDLANRGLASAPSGSAGAMFSGLAGNQNEALAAAQQNIMQQRFQNTMGQISQQQNFINSLGAQAGNDINSQYQRQLAGANAQTGNLVAASNQQTNANKNANEANLAAANFNVDNTPVNFMDSMTTGFNGALSNPMGMMNGNNSAQKQKGANPGQQTGAYQNANGTINPADSSAGLA